MDNNWTMELIHATVTTIMQRSANENEFRARCLKDPDGVIQEVGGLKPVDAGRVNFTENAREASLGGETITIALPAMGQSVDEREVRSSLGGDDAIWPWTSFMATCSKNPCKDD